MLYTSNGIGIGYWYL